MTPSTKKSLVWLLVAVVAIVILAFMSQKKDAPIVVTPMPTPEITGLKDDLVSFSVMPGAKVKGIMNMTGVLKNAYFFEANIRVDVLDANKTTIKEGFGTATTEWMTTGPVSFTTTIDFTGLTAGPAYIAIRNDNPSGLPENDKEIFIPIIIE